MLVFIDESGDPGFKTGSGSTPVFVAAMVIFRDAVGAQATEAAILSAKARLRVMPEFKFNKASDDIRDGFFSAVRLCPFTVRAIVVDKAVIRSRHLRQNREDFYRFFVRQMMSNDDQTLTGAKVIIDGSGDRDFKRELNGYLRRQLGDRLSELKFSDSRRDSLVQLADMCAGAIARSYRKDRDRPGRWRDMLAPRIVNVWDFG